MTIKIAPYKNGSRSALALADQLNTRCLKVNGSSRWRPRQGDIVINWGLSRWPFDWDFRQNRVWNNPKCVAIASDKLASSTLFRDQEVSTPSFTTDPAEVRRWLQSGYTVLARRLLRASGGRGIVKLQGADIDIPDAPMYTVYVPKRSEWRIHVFNGCLIDIQRKIARPDIEPVDWQIRNHDNGFIFQRDWDEGMWRDALEDEAIEAVEALGLDFGAVDVIWNERQSRAFVLEVNTAPGLEGQTLDNYVEAIEQI